MAGSSNFLVFNPGLARALSDANYEANTARSGGLVQGLAELELHNKLFAQLSVMTAALGQFIANAGYTASDADVVALTNELTNAIQSSFSMHGLDPFILIMLAE